VYLGTGRLGRGSTILNLTIFSRLVSAAKESGVKAREGLAVLFSGVPNACTAPRDKTGPVCKNFRRSMFVSPNDVSVLTILML
jgi:hypothetical protein